MIFNGQRLKQARILRGLTVAELAEKTSMQRQTISMYEIDKSRPSKEGIKVLSEALYFPVQFFYEKEIQQRGTVYFRSLLTTNKRYRNEQIAKMEIISQLYGMLQDYIEFPKFNPPEISNELSPQAIAEQIRAVWCLGQEPIENIISVVEQHGIPVTTFKTSTDDIDAFSEILLTGGAPTFLIAYSSNKTSAARIHFDIAHELGHIFLHEWSEDIEVLSRDEFKAREQQANDFAAAFLLPAEAFIQDVKSNPLSLVYYKQLKRKWKVSIAAMIRRARDLNVITTNDYQNLIRSMQRRGQRKEEPLDDVLFTASPAMIKTALIMLLQEGVFSPNEFMSTLSDTYGLSIYPEDVEELLDLPENTLSPKKIIDFNTILRLKTN